MTPARNERDARTLEERLAAWTPEERGLFASLEPGRIPSHVAIIMDGNGRWARRRGFRERIEGHRAAITAVRESTETCAEIGVRALTLYAFSKENWNRPRREVQALMRLLEDFLVAERPGLMKNNIRLVASGQIEDLGARALAALSETMRLTAGNGRLVLNLALSYSGREEIVGAAREIACAAARGELRPEELSIERFATFLYHPELGDPDLLIRTSGEMRVSNFLLWQIAYTEIYITDVLWPDFRRRHLLDAIADYTRRDRRFGGLKDPPDAEPL